MDELLERHEAVIPTKEEAAMAAESSRILARASKGDDLRVTLENGEDLVLPRAAATLLTHLLTEMSNGNAVTIIPIHAELTTQEAADHLNVSRPHLIKLLERGEIPFHMVGTHRRIRFEDLRSYKRHQAKQAEAAMEELARQAQDLDMGY